MSSSRMQYWLGFPAFAALTALVAAGTACNPTSDITAEGAGRSTGVLATSTTCSGATIDVTTDPENCGDCGHSCGGGTCDSGSCGLVLVAKSDVKDGIFTLLALDEDVSKHVYVTSDLQDGTGHGKVYATPLDGKTLTAVADAGADDAHPYAYANASYAFAAAPPALYYTLGASVMTASLDGSQAHVLVSGPGRQSSLAIDDANVYYLSLHGDAIMSAPRAGGAPATLISLPKPSPGNTDIPEQGVWADADSVYYSDCSLRQIRKVSKQGGASALVAPVDDCMIALTVDAANVYWMSFDKILSAPKDGGAVTMRYQTNHAGPGPFAEGSRTNGGIAVDATHLYWAEGLDGMFAIRKQALAGGAVSTLAMIPTLGIMTNIVVGKTDVYWGQQVGAFLHEGETGPGSFSWGVGAIFKAPK